MQARQRPPQQALRTSTSSNTHCSQLRRPCAARRAPAVTAAAAAAAATSPSSSSSAGGPVSWSPTSNGAWVASPRGVASARRPPTGVVHLLGGAFAGAAPQVLYGRLAEALAAPPAAARRGYSGGGGGSGYSGGGGFTVIATPYRLTFDHMRSAERVRRDLREAAEEVAASGEGGPHAEAARRACSALLAGGGGSGGSGAPLFAVGHSNGALLHALGACQQQRQQEEEEQEEREQRDGAPTGQPRAPPPPPRPLLLRPRGTVLISYNNKGIGDAVPFGVLDGLRAALGPPPPPGAPGAAALPPLPPPIAQALPARVARASPALEQVGTVADEVRRGASDFDPPPARTREIVSGTYPRAALAAGTRTLLVRFSDDGTDETPELGRMLGGCPGLDAITLPGTHLTPCGADEALLRAPAAAGLALFSGGAFGGGASGGGPGRRAVPSFTPADAIAMAAREWGRAARERDADRLAERVVSFLRAAAAAPPP